MAISSTTFSSLRSSGSRVLESTRRPPRDSATALPPLESCAVLNRLPPVMIASVPPAASRKSLRIPKREARQLTLMAVGGRALKDQEGGEVNRRDDEHHGDDEVEHQQLGVAAGLVLAREEVHALSGR